MNNKKTDTTAYRPNKNITPALRQEYDEFLADLRSRIIFIRSNSVQDIKRDGLHRQRLAYEVGMSDSSISRYLTASIEDFNLGAARFYYYCVVRLGLDTTQLVRLCDEILLVTVSEKQGKYERISEHGSIIREAYALALGSLKLFSKMTGVCPVSTLMYIRGKYKVQSPAVLHGLIAISKQVIADQKQRIVAADGTAALYVGKLAKNAKFAFAVNEV